jgi:hypothetical protein
MRTWMLLAVLALVFAGCEEKKGAEPGKTEPTKTEPTKVEPTKTEPVKVEPKKEEAKKEEAKKEDTKTAAGSAEENCGALYDFTKQLTEAFAKKLGKAGVGKELPAREKFVAGCKELPPEVSRCMNPQVMMKEQAKCTEIMKNADPAKVMKFKQMMGGK